MTLEEDYKGRIMFVFRCLSFELTEKPLSSLIANAAESGLSYETNPNPRDRPVSFSTMILTLRRLPYGTKSWYISTLVK